MRWLILNLMMITLLGSDRAIALDVYIKQAELDAEAAIKLDAVAVDDQIVNDFSRKFCQDGKNDWVGSTDDAQVILIPKISRVGEDFHLSIKVMIGKQEIKTARASFHSPKRMPAASAKALTFALSRNVLRRAKAQHALVQDDPPQ